LPCQSFSLWTKRLCLQQKGLKTSESQDLQSNSPNSIPVTEKQGLSILHRSLGQLVNFEFQVLVVCQADFAELKTRKTPQIGSSGFD
jgi:hypothetical protein